MDNKTPPTDGSTDSPTRAAGQPDSTNPTASRPGNVDNDIASIERQNKIDALRTKEDYLEQYDPPKKKRRFLRFLGWMLLIVLLTGGGAAAGWYFWLGKEPKAVLDTSQTDQSPAAATPPAAKEEPTETHTSSAFLLEFAYPEGWTVTEGADNKIVAVSPAMKLKAASGSAQIGQVMLTIQHKQVSLPRYKDTEALAAIESEKIDYKKPSQVQRASTYISFLDYLSSAGKGVDEIYVTGDNGYQANQYIPQADVIKSDPLIAFSFRKCADDKCATPGEAISIAASAWQDASFSKPLKTMLQSIVVQ